ncbi:bifunctional salicylyl-CoA 5-hydroxylase/oxidoreductase [Limobrevibacterium gyesilva]|uniref:Bifunctional salicylyl-CoA 5-hydroxylase/oxidoreductase n=1 Tax=Limobrevibacterium gyesilva TaxID=2991712 RepID=A0AA41YIR8_9PROT|nr:bifunctional salicylyl-CoA 5-hydroxylase/oxidoreductase [Limobrevibacterium gyesilva]MCW3474374.1 bifunctional salicylyl-CoA 5-hydroxylase/oxidoreductase [Limobrevibacterium gyesilva]
MRIAILGGGPAGLYFAILMKKTWSQSDVTVYERNRSDDTFGFGVVFSDATLETFEKYDYESYQAITRNFAYWDDIEIRFKDTLHRIGGNGFCGCARRTLLMLLQDRASALGVKLHFQTEIKSIDEVADADLIIAADGINSFVRETFKAHFRPEMDLRPNRFAWMGSTKPLDAFTFSFRETEHGVFIAHAYQYEPGHSTWVMETDAGTFERAGLGAMDEQQSAAFLQRVFAEDLDGHKLQINRSLWRRFPMIRNARCVMDNVVLLGDAKATAHFSIGSGTKLAMEDAIALFEAFKANGSVNAALHAFETGRREDVERIQHAADVSLVWFEHVRRFWGMDPTQFAFGLMTRSKSITYDNLKLRAPEFVADTDRMFARGVAASGFKVDVETPLPPMFQPFALRDMVVANRVVVSPMCMYSATDGMPGDWHVVHYGARGIGGAGLMFTEMTCVASEARITPGCAGMYTDAHEAAWKRIVDFVHAHGETKFAMQLGHAGRKGATKLMWEGIDRPLAAGAWPIVAPSPVPYYPDSQVPREMTRADMDQVRDDFVAATRRALRAGFDMVELHCAHGYLLASFISPLTNHRTDEYGGALENRLRFPLEVFDAMRAVWPNHKPMSVRISATDWEDGGITGDDAVEIARAFSRHGCDLIDVSTGQTTPEARPVYGRMFQTPFSDQIRNDGPLATMCVGNITTADQVNTILAAGRADLVALARPHLVNPYFTLHAAAQYGVSALACPVQYEPGQSQLFRTAEQAQAELTELKLKARPKTHDPALLRAAE